MVKAPNELRTIDGESTVGAGDGSSHDAHDEPGSRRLLIDGFAFAERQEARSGAVDAEASRAAFPRLAESGARDVQLEWAVEGGETALGRPALRVRASGEVTLDCQRCLQPVRHPFSLEAELELARDLAAVEGADDDIDRIVAGPAMDVLHLVEDEVLLELPMVPRHEQCVALAEADRAAPTLANALARWREGGGGAGQGREGKGGRGRKDH